MRIQFRIENPRQLKPAYRSKMVFTARGGVIGASEEADWPLQDVHNSLPDFLARIELRDEKWLVTSFPGANVFLNKSSSPLRPNKAVILRRDDLLSFGDLKVYFSDDFSDDMDYERYDDAVEVSALVTVNKGHKGFIDSQAVEIDTSKVPHAQSYSQESKWSGHSIVEVDDVDALLGANPAYIAERKTRNKPDSNWEKYFNEPAYQGSLLEQTQMSDHEPKWKSEFEDFETEEVIMNSENEPMQTPKSDTMTASQILIILSRELGIPLGEIPEDELSDVLADIAMTLRTAIAGINGFYSDQLSGNTGAAMARANVHAIEDNPLRFSKDANEALRVMFLERHDVHLAPQAAVRDSLDQMELHNSSIRQSVDEGLENLLHAFEPENLERRFASYRRKDEDMDEVARDAWYWRTYKAYIQEMSNQRQQGLSRLFWEVFQNAYQEQMRGAKNSNQQSKSKEV